MLQPLADVPRHDMHFQSIYHKRMSLISNNNIVFLEGISPMALITMGISGEVVKYSNFTLILSVKWSSERSTTLHLVVTIVITDRKFLMNIGTLMIPNSSMIQKYFHHHHVMVPKLFQMTVWRLMIKNFLMIPKYSKIQR